MILRFCVHVNNLYHRNLHQECVFGCVTGVQIENKNAPYIADNDRNDGPYIADNDRNLHSIVILNSSRSEGLGVKLFVSTSLQRLFE